MFFSKVFDTVKNICIKTLTIKFKRKRFLLSEKNKKSKTIGYARAIDSEFDYLKEQIKCLKKMANFFLKVIFKFLPDLIRNLISLVK